MPNTFWADHFGAGSDTKSMDAGGVARRKAHLAAAKREAAESAADQAPGRSHSDDFQGTQAENDAYQRRMRREQANEAGQRPTSY